MDSLNRADIKKTAKSALRAQTSTMVLAYLILTLITTTFVGLYEAIFSSSQPAVNPTAGMWLSSMVFNFVIVIIAGVLRIGFVKMSLAALRGEQQSTSDVFGVFKDFAHVAGLVFVTLVKIFLWSLLFIIPGIIAQYRYAMVYYIYLENPELTYDETLKLSSDMMRGHKFELFVFQLSFFLWVLLGIVTFGLAMLWVGPYMQIGEAEFYNRLKASAIPAPADDVHPEALSSEEPVVASNDSAE